MSLPEAAKLPIVKLAAGAVIVLSAVGVGAMTGLIPGVASQENPAAVVTESETAKPEPAAPAAKPSIKAPARVAATEPQRQAAPAATCLDCGVVQSVQAIEVKGEGSGLGAVAGGVAGLVIGNQVGDGRGKKLAKVAGAVGGAYAGHQIEKNMKKTVQYQIDVRMNDGSMRTVTQSTDNGLSAGDRVKIVENSVIKS